MCFRPNRATPSRRRRSLRPRQAPTLPPLAMLDLAKPGERQAHDFLLRATGGRERMWKLINLRRDKGTLLCVVRWMSLDNAARPFSLADVSLTEAAVHWQNYATIEEAQTKLERRCAHLVLPTAGNR